MLFSREQKPASIQMDLYLIGIDEFALIARAEWKVRFVGIPNQS